MRQGSCGECAGLRDGACLGEAERLADQPWAASLAFALSARCVAGSRGAPGWVGGWVAGAPGWGRSPLGWVLLASLWLRVEESPAPLPKAPAASSASQR